MNRYNKALVPVENRELSTSKSQASILCKNAAPIVISWPSDMACKPNTNDSNKKCVPRVIPVVPVKPRNNSAITVGLTQQFSSTTFVNGAKDEATTICEALPKCNTPNNTYFNSKYLKKDDETTLEVPVETLVSDNNEIQTIHVGNFSSIRSINDVDTTTEETFIASKDSSGIYYVTVQKANVDNSLIPDPITRYVPASKISCYTKRGIIRYGKSRMIADTHTSISVREFKAQLNDTSDTIGQMEIAPPTKYFMNTLNTKGVNKLFANPGRPMSFTLSRSYVRHLTMKQIRGQQTFGDLELPPLTFISKEMRADSPILVADSSGDFSDGDVQELPLDEHSKAKQVPRKRRHPEAKERQQKLLSERLTPEPKLSQGLDGEMRADSPILVEDSSGDFSDGDVQELDIDEQSQVKQVPRKRRHLETKKSQQKLLGERLTPAPELSQGSDEEMHADSPILVADSSGDFSDEDVQELSVDEQSKINQVRQMHRHPEAKESQQKLLSEHLTPEAELSQGSDEEMRADSPILVADSSGDFSDGDVQELTLDEHSNVEQVPRERRPPEAQECQQNLLSEHLTPEPELSQGLDDEMHSDSPILVEDSSGEFSDEDVQELVMTLQSEKEPKENQSTIIMVRDGQNESMGDLAMKNVEALLTAAENYYRS